MHAQCRSLCNGRCCGVFGLCAIVLFLFVLPVETSIWALLLERDLVDPQGSRAWQSEVLPHISRRGPEHGTQDRSSQSPPSHVREANPSPLPPSRGAEGEFAPLCVQRSLVKGHNLWPHCAASGVAMSVALLRLDGKTNVASLLCGSVAYQCRCVEGTWGWQRPVGGEGVLSWEGCGDWCREVGSGVFTALVGR
eukprot:15440507-Alexandrium_andersonii.AAC.1